MNIASSSTRTGGQVLVDQLVAAGVDTVFGVPGESYLAVLDGLYERRDKIRMIINRQEGGAAFMADAYARTTGKVGVCFVTRGPGATNASIGVHTAHQDSVPLILFVGQVGTDFLDREAFQEIDYRRMFGSMCKWVAQIDRADRIPEYVSHALHVAQQGRPGPVVLALPEDMLVQRVDVPDILPPTLAHSAPAPLALAQVATLLESAKRPFVLLGGGGWTALATRQITQFIERFELPVGCAFRRQDLFNNHHPAYAGDVGLGINPKLAQRIREADLLLVVGCTLGEVVTHGYSLLNVPCPTQTLVHIAPGSDDLGRVYSGLLIQSSLEAAASALASLDLPDRVEFAAAQRAAREEYEQWQMEPAAPKQAALNPWAVVKELRRTLPADTLIANGAGNFATWAHRFWRYGDLANGGRQQLAPACGAMGYGVPAGIAAKLAAPHRCVVIFAGDGDFMMNGQELATAIQYGAGVIILLFNNGMYGTIRMHQAREFPGRSVGTDLINPDFVALARAYGGWGTLVSRTDEFPDALTNACAFAGSQNKPALIELRIDPEVITPAVTLQQIESRARNPS